MIREGLVPVDDLNAPLGQNIQEKQRSAAVITSRRMIAAGLIVLVLGAGAGALLAIYPLGKPTASLKAAAPDKAGPERTGSIEESRPVEIIRPGTASPVPPAKPGAIDPPATQTITIIDGTSGKREQIVVPAKPQPTR
jgi:hypothetical protein